MSIESPQSILPTMYKINLSVFYSSLLLNMQCRSGAKTILVGEFLVEVE